MIIYLLACQSQTDSTAYGLLTPETFNEVLKSHKDLIVLDVRTPAEYANGHIGDATNVDIQSPAFAQQIANMDKDAEYAVYCAVGRRSALAVEQMKSMGFNRVYDLKGGYNAWVQQQSPAK